MIIGAESKPVFFRKRKTVDPCPCCFLHRMRCICQAIPNLVTKTRLELFIHYKELKRTTNTGRLAVQALENSAMHVRGEKDRNPDFDSILSDQYEAYVLFPSQDAIDIHEMSPKKPVQLIVSDGNWRQASKLNTRHPELAHLPRVKISDKNLGKFHLRKEHLMEGLSTLEAIAQAFRVLEGETVGEQLRALYQAKLRATLEGRGKFPHLETIPACC